MYNKKLKAVFHKFFSCVETIKNIQIVSSIFLFNLLSIAGYGHVFFPSAIWEWKSLRIRRWISHSGVKWDRFLSHYQSDVSWRLLSGILQKHLSVRTLFPADEENQIVRCRKFPEIGHTVSYLPADCIVIFESGIR